MVDRAKNERFPDKTFDAEFYAADCSRVCIINSAHIQSLYNTYK